MTNVKIEMTLDRETTTKWILSVSGKVSVSSAVQSLISGYTRDQRLPAAPKAGAKCHPLFVIDLARWQAFCGEAANAAIPSILGISATDAVFERLMAKALGAPVESASTGAARWVTQNMTLTTANVATLMSQPRVVSSGLPLSVYAYNFMGNFSSGNPDASELPAAPTGAKGTYSIQLLDYMWSKFVNQCNVVGAKLRTVVDPNTVLDQLIAYTLAIWSAE